MITASHNPEPDNGVKVVDHQGAMVSSLWEERAEELVNCRPSSMSLASAVRDGVTVLGAEHVDYGLLSTPQLHFIVHCMNSGQAYGKASEEGYYDKLCSAFTKLVPSGRHGDITAPGHVYVDGANGVGALKLQALLTHLNGELGVTVVNNGTDGKLNYRCGADFVKSQRHPPDGLTVERGMRCVSFDGDADRIVYFYLDDADGGFRVLDGDRIAVLVADFLQQMLRASGLVVRMGVVQTGYSNGNCTKYIVDVLKLPVLCTLTGVKNLHRKAQEEFDIGIYFEANGHGTVLFSDQAVKAIKEQSTALSASDEQRGSAAMLVNVIDVINQTVGDAMSDLLLVEAILDLRRWSVEDWHGMYRDAPSRQSKVPVKERGFVQSNSDCTRATFPEGLQEVIDDLVSQFVDARSFVRSSGTEDVVRVYAEAATQDQADRLAYRVASAVYDMAGGVGDRPTAL